MLTSQQRVFRKFWHAAVPMSTLRERQPVPFTLLGEPIAPIPEAPESGAPGWRTIFRPYEAWATSPLHALENSFDNSHFSFVHCATFGVAAPPRPSRYERINCLTPNDDRGMQLVQWLFRNDTEADCPEAMLVEFDRQITAEDREMLEATDPDALVDTRRRGVEFSMDSDRPGMLIRKQLMELLARHGEQEIHAGA